MNNPMLLDHSHPNQSDVDIQYKMYIKRDFIIHKIPQRKEMKTYEDIKEYRYEKCGKAFEIAEHQALISNTINPQTPHSGLIIYHGVGSGKTFVSIATAEKFKDMVIKYGNKITVIVPGPKTKSNYYREIINGTGNTYIDQLKYTSPSTPESEKRQMLKNAINMINMYYSIMSYRSFTKKVIGDRIIEKVEKDGKLIHMYKKNDKGDYIREMTINPIVSLDNTLLIIDEAQGAIDNELANAIEVIKNKSTNLKILELSATPMKNSALDIIPLLNFLRPKDSQIDRDKVFTRDNIYDIKFKKNGREYLRNMCRGYVSYLRGADPLTFAERVDIGTIPPGLKFSKLVRCYMDTFQANTYAQITEDEEDHLDKKSGAAANMVFPCMNKDGQLIGVWGNKGIVELKKILSSKQTELCKLIAKQLNITKNINNLLYLTNNGKTITGDIYKLEYLPMYSIKFYMAISDILLTVDEKQGSGPLFVYFNLVQSGVDIFVEILKANGYLEYQENPNMYIINDNTICYRCGINHSNHSNEHIFYPATFITVTGQSEDQDDKEADDENNIYIDIFNRHENRYGKIIKILIGSRVMGEGVTLHNIKNIYIMDMHYNLGRNDQVIGRGIRYCKHYGVYSEDNQFPKVEIRRYVVSNKNSDNLTSEEILYKKAEDKYLLVKETERILQEEAIDCPLNYNGNIFPEEKNKYKNCKTYDKDYTEDDKKNNQQMCPAICGYLPCEYKCSSKKLNAKYYDENRNIYKKVEKMDIDYSTYDISMAVDEINYVKKKIKELYYLDTVYKLEDIQKYVYDSLPDYKKEIYDEYYVYQALDQLIPLDINDFNNFRDVIYDKYDRPGYLIYRNKYYIFQRFDQTENTPIYYRQQLEDNIYSDISLRNYMRMTKEYDDSYVNDVGRKQYDFDSIQDYYDNRPEFTYVGIIDNKVDISNPSADIFKLRGKRPKLVIKKRETGMPSYKGSVCGTTGSKEDLAKILKKISVQSKESNRSNNKTDLCEDIKDKLLEMEKYATKKDGNKMTYVIIPRNHKIYSYPYNLEDRIEHILTIIKNSIKTKLNYEIEKKTTKGKYLDIKYATYKIIINTTTNNDINSVLFEKYGFKKIKNNYELEIK
jgi:hypothetical protein